jgi:hypothetical protein
MRSEIDFIDAIDCCFPYDERGSAEALVDEGCSISPNVAFMVIHELARRPRSCQTSDARCLELLDRVAQRLDHPLTEIIALLTRRMIRAEMVTSDQAIEAIHVVGRYPGQFNALNIAYFASTDYSEAVEAAHREVATSWEQAESQSKSSGARRLTKPVFVAAQHRVPRTAHCCRLHRPLGGNH